jgi:acyl-CoA reductase-like NAD-dependent aldehyde dehydrogenase
MSHRIAREEIFGPVLSILTFRTFEEAVEKPTTPPTASAPASGPTKAAASSK